MIEPVHTGERGELHGMPCPPRSPPLNHQNHNMEQEIARRIIQSLTSASSEVATTIELIRGKVQDDEFEQYVQAVGAILASIQLDLMARILKDHPELDADR